MTPQETIDQLNSIISSLIEFSLCNKQNFPSVNVGVDGITDISFKGAGRISVALKNQPYRDIFYELDKHEAYSVQMLDGAIIQLLYRFKDSKLISHRLAFFPSPDLEDFQNQPEIYEEDEIYADVLMKNIVPFPVRFDFDVDDDLFVELDHPKSHLTLGQYKNCRIPATAPLTPFQFVSFILRSFYNTAHRKYSAEIGRFEGEFTETILGEECEVLHINV